jgi:Na+/proline symporter
MGTVTIAYTFFGGLRSVVWNDCIQLLIYLVGGLSAVVLLTRLVPGGWQEITEFAAQTGRLRLVDWRFSLSDPYNVWAGLLGGAVLTIGTHGTDHMMVQRYLSARSRREAGRAIIWSAVVVMAQFALFLWIGVQLACFYSGSAAVESIKADQVFARFIVDHFPQNVGLVGLMLAAILAAAMSTLSSSLNASASALLNDFYLPARRRAFRRVGGSHHGSPRPRISLKTVWVPVPAKQRGHRRLADHAVAGDRTEDSQLLKLSKLMTLGFGGLQMIIGVWASTLEESVINNALTIAGFSAGLLLGIFALGLAWRPISPAAVIAGAVLGAIVLGTVSFLLKSDGGRPLIAWPWMALVGSGTTFVAGSVCRFVIPASAAGGRTE